MSAATEVEVDGRALSISNPDKVYFSKRGETKLDLVRYYQAVAEPLLGVIGGRPLLLERYPDGASGKSWFQKRVPKSAPDWLRTVEVSTPNGTTSDALVAHDLAHILWAVNQGCLGFHVWPNHVPDLTIADELRIDLDPSPGIGFEDLRRAAVRTRELLAELGIDCRIKTSGSRGLHIYAALEPRWDGYEVRAAAVALARELERRHPEEITAQWWKEERGSRVFIDFNQYKPSSSTPANTRNPWSKGARPGVPLSHVCRLARAGSGHCNHLLYVVDTKLRGRSGTPLDRLHSGGSVPVVLGVRGDAERGHMDEPLSAATVADTDQIPGHECFALQRATTPSIST